uniref:E3 ubiquitin-protein ligase CBL n=1 Tax=Dermatophagoides pteronyssinus TaxID=6956 RepID=A0A6P6XMG6_DERPT|nr:E3 ubiquitin-protein ligase CBL-like [Dermatophagoides pteronyssinus]
MSTQKTTVDRRNFEKTYKNMNKVVKLCQHSRMNLKNSPPFILDILPETFQHLTTVYSKHEDRLNILDENEYFRIFLENLNKKCKQDPNTWIESLHSLPDNNNVIMDIEAKSTTFNKWRITTTATTNSTKKIITNNNT